jgi:hypothetical protein
MSLLSRAVRRCREGLCLCETSQGGACVYKEAGKMQGAPVP